MIGDDDMDDVRLPKVTDKGAYKKVLSQLPYSYRGAAEQALEYLAGIDHNDCFIPVQDFGLYGYDPEVIKRICNALSEYICHVGYVREDGTFMSRGMSVSDYKHKVYSLYRPIPEEFINIAEKYSTIVVRDIWNDGFNEGGYAYGITLSPFDDPDLERIAFFHELGHHVNTMNSMVKYNLSTLANEGAAWQTGLELAAKHGYHYEYNSTECIWARQQLASYVKSGYN
jgi:hypothetical protein